MAHTTHAQYFRTSKDAESWYTLASEKMHRGDYQEAIGMFDKALTIDPDYTLAWHCKGQCLDDLGKFNDAVECYDKALEIDPYHSDTWYNKSISLKKMGKLDDAKVCIDTAIDLALGR